MSLGDDIRARKVHACVIGLGYVGLPLALEFIRAGYKVAGLDIDASRVAQLRAGISYVLDVPDENVRKSISTGRFEVTTDSAVLSEVQTVNICVPTPLGKTGDPDLSLIKSAFNDIVKNRRPGQLYILESTTYPGTTEEVLLAALSEGGGKVGKDYYLAFSPERVDPGNPHYNIRNIPKVVGGVTPACTECAAALYENCVETVVKVSSPRVAEMVKLLENTFRSVNIGLVNELARMCHTLDVDIWEVIETAKTKPFGFMPFHPGPGLGGHCLPVDSIYLSWKARQAGFESRFIELAGQVNASMPQFVLDLVVKLLNERGKPLKGARILLLGITYKADVNDIRESPALDVWHLLARLGAEVGYHDPYVPKYDFEGKSHKSVPLDSKVLGKTDCGILLANHKTLDISHIYDNCKNIIDTRNAFKGYPAREGLQTL